MFKFLQYDSITLLLNKYLIFIGRRGKLIGPKEQSWRAVFRDNESSQNIFYTIGFKYLMYCSLHRQYFVFPLELGFQLCNNECRSKVLVSQYINILAIIKYHYRKMPLAEWLINQRIMTLRISYKAISF